MYSKAAKGWMKHLDFIILDLVCLELALFFAYHIRLGSLNLLGSLLYRNMLIILFLIEISVVFFFETFKNVLKRSFYREVTVTLKHDCLVVLLSSFYLILTQNGDNYSRIVLILTGVIYFLLSLSLRYVWKKYLLHCKGQSMGSRSLVIVTTESLIGQTIAAIRENNYQRFRIAGIVATDRNMAGQWVNGIPVVADTAGAADYVCRQWVDEVLINLPPGTPICADLIRQFMEMGVTVHFKLVDARDMLTRKQFMERLGNYTVLTTSLGLYSARQQAMKRLLDILGGLTGCVITLALLLFVGPCIYIKSPGPVFFSQIRVGRNGKKFKIYKFRSMYLDAEERKKELLESNRVSSGMMFKLEWDPRIIGSEKGPGRGIGNFIRKYSIDEFPQFFNVLKGEMSLVGTRPPTVDEWEKYDLHHRARLAVKPGLTGMWQVSGRSKITDFEQVVSLDKQYITEWNFALDIKILLKTVLVVLGKEGSM